MTGGGEKESESFVTVLKLKKEEKERQWGNERRRLL